jgi:hypothetical protein
MNFDLDAMRTGLRQGFAEAGVAYGSCCCGCGAPTTVADRTNTKYGYVRGEPKLYIRGHARRLTDRIPGPNPSGLCKCGCGETTPIATVTQVSRGAVGGRPLSYVHGHNRRKTSSEIIEGVHYCVDESGCWTWLLGRSGHGYGEWLVPGRGTRAHRAAYEQFVGEIPEGLHLHHACRNRACVNPDHLEPVTQAEHNRLHAEVAA